MQCEIPSMALSAVAFAMTTAAMCACAFATEAQGAQAMILRGGIVYDGTGAPGVRADVLVEGDTIKAIGGDLSAADARIVDVSGLAVCPGFIDAHCHVHEGLVDKGPREDEEGRQMQSVVGQGVTTIVVGMDGWGLLPLAAYAEDLAKYPFSANIARLAGHANARLMVIGKEKRPATAEEISKMAAIIDQAMKDGAFGLSSGLEYLGDYVTTEELIALAKVAAPYGGYYETHLRNEDVTVFEAAQEAIRICREGGNIPLSISHIKVGSPEVWHQSGRLEKVLDDARAGGLRVYSNWRPSILWSSNLKGLDKDGAHDLKAIDTELRKHWPNADPYLYRCESHAELVGMTLDKIAESWSTTPAEALVRIWGFGRVAFEFNGSTWEDSRVFINDPWCMVVSDGDDGTTVKRPDPLNRNSFAIFFGSTVRERKWFPLETAVYKCTGLPAKMVGLKDRGVLRPGMKADVVVFDPATIRGEQHWDKPTAEPTGIAYTIVNGVVVMDHGKHTGAEPGIFIRKR